MKNHHPCKHSFFSDWAILQNKLLKKEKKKSSTNGQKLSPLYIKKKTLNADRGAAGMT